MTLPMATAARPRRHDLLRAGAIVLPVVMASRLLLDLAGQARWAGAPLPRVGSTLLILVCGVLAAAGWPHLRRHPTLPVLGVYAAAVLTSAARATDHASAARFSLLYLSPFVLLLAVHACIRQPVHARRWLAAPLWVAPLPIALAFLAFLAGQPHEHVLHGYPRLFGGYANHHNHALAMAMLLVLALYHALERPRRYGFALALIASGASFALWHTYVRTAWLLLAVAGVVMIALRSRWLAGATLAVLAAAVAMSATLRDRFMDLGALLTLNAPPGGWEAIGSWRFAIWQESMAAFLAAGPTTWALGTGLGGHLQLCAKTLDPHNDYLALLYQLGPVGPVAYLALHGIVARQAWRARHSASTVQERGVADLVLALIAASLVTNAISNTFLGRPTIAWLLWGTAGLLPVAQKTDSRTYS